MIAKLARISKIKECNGRGKWLCDDDIPSIVERKMEHSSEKPKLQDTFLNHL